MLFQLLFRRSMVAAVTRIDAAQGKMRVRFDAKRLAIPHMVTCTGERDLLIVVDVAAMHKNAPRTNRSALLQLRAGPVFSPAYGRVSTEGSQQGRWTKGP